MEQLEMNREVASGEVHHLVISAKAPQYFAGRAAADPSF
jgi:hypothetical protein